jgi:sirohydrochlorin ferrochelatase
MSDNSPQHLGLIIVDHGSIRAESNVLLEQFVERFITETDYEIVEPAHMELVEPSIATALDCCVARGANHIIVVPYFLGPGKHWDADIPNLTAQAAAKHQGVSWRIAEPIGLHPLMVQIVQERAAQMIDPCGQ